MPVSAKLTVLGTDGADPNSGQKTTLTVTVTVDGKGLPAFESCVQPPYTYHVDDAADGVTVLEVMQHFFDETKYTSNIDLNTGGNYISFITDPNCVTLEGPMGGYPYGGWLYQIGGEFADAINVEYVEDNDQISFFYTENDLLEEGFEEYDKNRALADDVIAKIDTIPALGEITLADAGKINLAKRAYDDLNQTKPEVCEVMIPAEKKDKLEKSVARLLELQKLDAVEKKISSLPAAADVKLTDKKAIEEAAAAFGALTKAQQAKINSALREKLAGSTGKDGKLYYRPNNSMTRQEFVVALMRYLDVNTQKYASVELPFADNAAIASWAQGAMKAAYSLGYMAGSNEQGKLFANPGTTITRQEAMVILSRTLSDKTDAVADLERRFTDAAQVSAWACEGLCRMLNAGIISGSNGKLNPTGSVTRAEVAKMLWMLADSGK